MITDWIVTGCWLFFSLAIGLNIISTAICSWKLTTEKKNKMSKGKLLILIQLHGTHILLRKVSSTHVQIFFNVKFFFFAFKILCLHTWCIQIIFALPGKDTLICTSMQIQWHPLQRVCCTIHVYDFYSFFYPTSFLPGGIPQSQF